MSNYNYDFVNPCVLDEVKRRTQHQCYAPKSLGIKLIENACVFPYRNDSRGEVISEEMVALATDFPKKADPKIYDRTTVIKHKGKAIFLGSFFTWGWGHCFTDHFNKLWFFLTDDCKNMMANGTECVLVTANPKIPNYVYTLFEYAGFDLHQAKIVTEPTIYEEFFIPDNCYYQIDDGWYRYYTDEYVSLLENMKARARSEATSHGNFIAPERIYITRTQGAFSSAYRDVGE